MSNSTLILPIAVHQDADATLNVNGKRCREYSSYFDVTDARPTQRRRIHSVRITVDQTREETISSNKLYLCRSQQTVEISSSCLGTLIGSGQFGQVYKQQIAETCCAVKRIRNETDAVAKVQFENEVAVMCKLPSHPNVNSIFGYCRSPLLIASPFAAGGNLSTVISYWAKTKLSVQEAKIVQYLKEICQGMQHIHQHGIVHRDLALRNILLDNKGRAVVSDFGLSRTVNTEDVIQEDADGCLLPIPWMPVEALEVKNKIQYSRESDVWSFGILVWEIYTGLAPHIKCGERLKKPWYCGEGVWKIVEECLEEERSKRPTFERILEELEAVAGDKEVRISPESVEEEIKKRNEELVQPAGKLEFESYS